MAGDKQSQDLLQVQGRMALGYGIIPKLAMQQDQRLTIEAKAIYSYFCSYAGAGTTAFPGRSKILRDLKISEDRYYRHFTMLKKFGYITVEKHKGEGGKFKRNIYTLVEMIAYNQNGPASPYPQNKGTEPYPYFPGTDEPGTENKGANNNSININNSNIIKSGQRQPLPDGEASSTPTADNDRSHGGNIIIFGKEKAPAATPIPSYQQQAEAAEFNQEHYNMYKDIIQANIDYISLTSMGGDREFVDSLVQIMLDVILIESPDTIRIGKEIKSRDIVKSVYLKLKWEHIQHVIAQYKEQRHQITHKTAYLRTMLYNAYHEIEPHFTNQVRADGAVF